MDVFLITDPDLWFTIGVTLGILCVPSLFSAFTDGRTPRASAVTILIAVGMIGFASYSNPEGYDFAEIPSVFAEVFGLYIL